MEVYVSPIKNYDLSRVCLECWVPCHPLKTRWNAFQRTDRTCICTSYYFVILRWKLQNSLRHSSRITLNTYIKQYQNVICWLRFIGRAFNLGKESFHLIVHNGRLGKALKLHSSQLDSKQHFYRLQKATL